MSKPTNPRCFFDIEIAGRKAGRLIFELFANEVPKTVENFRALCTGERGRSATSGATLHYKGSPIHRIVEGFMLQGGDFTTGDGKGGESIYGGAFADESFERKHTAEFLLSMANRGPNTNGSQFFITCVPTPHLDGKHVVFGRLVSGQDLVREIEVLPVDKKSRPHDQVLISNSGELERVVTKRRKSPSVHSDSSEEGRNSRKKKEKKRRRRRSPSTSGSSSSSESSVSSSEEQDRKRKSKEKRKPKKSKRSSTAEPQEAVDSAPAEEYVGIAPPDDIGGTSNFLMRNLDTRDTRRRPTMLSTEKRVDKAGRVVKGRGSLVGGH
ncbi:cyclophilin-like domain-containing protein [Powellomyces hirtus]|nr:cyclophilin-like domain-containing protein [Powellomyces hirtus]